MHAQVSQLKLCFCNQSRSPFHCRLGQSQAGHISPCQSISAICTLCARLASIVRHQAKTGNFVSLGVSLLGLEYRQEASLAGHHDFTRATSKVLPCSLWNHISIPDDQYRRHWHGSKIRMMFNIRCCCFMSVCMLQHVGQSRDVTTPAMCPKLTAYKAPAFPSTSVLHHAGKSLRATASLQSAWLVSVRKGWRVSCQS